MPIWSLTSPRSVPNGCGFLFEQNSVKAALIRNRSSAGTVSIGCPEGPPRLTPPVAPWCTGPGGWSQLSHRGHLSTFGSWESAIPQMGGWLILTLFQQLRQLRDIRSNVSQGRHQFCSCDGVGRGALNGVFQNDTFNRRPSWWCLTSDHVLAGQFAGQTGCKCEQNGKAG